MHVDEHAQMLLAAGRKIRESYTKMHPGDTGGILPIMEFWRGDDQVATVHFTSGHREEIMTAMRVGAIGFAADAIAQLMEAWGVRDQTATGINPDTGECWQPGGMAAYVSRHGRGLVRDCLHATVANAAGDVGGASRTFTVKGHKLCWDEPVFLPHSEGALRGTFPDTMTWALSRVGATAPMRAAMERFGGRSQEVITALCDCWTAKSLEGSIDAVIALSCGEHEHERRATIEAEMGRPMHTDVGEAFDAARRKEPPTSRR